jgi:hypothetical protein
MSRRDLSGCSEDRPVDGSDVVPAVEDAIGGRGEDLQQLRNERTAAPRRDRVVDHPVAPSGGFDRLDEEPKMRVETAGLAQHSEAEVRGLVGSPELDVRLRERRRPERRLELESVLVDPAGASLEECHRLFGSFERDESGSCVDVRDERNRRDRTEGADDLEGTFLLAVAEEPFDGVSEREASG